jgi:hypothetical protein
VRLYQELYFDFNIQHFQEKLSEEHGIKLSYTWVQKALQGAGLVARGKRRGKHRRRRERRAPARDAAAHACVRSASMGVNITGSKTRAGTMVTLNNATSEIYYADWWRRNPLQLGS